MKKMLALVFALVLVLGSVVTAVALPAIEIPANFSEKEDNFIFSGIPTSTLTEEQQDFMRRFSDHSSPFQNICLYTIDSVFFFSYPLDSEDSSMRIDFLPDKNNQVWLYLKNVSYIKFKYVKMREPDIVFNEYVNSGDNLKAFPGNLLIYLNNTSETNIDPSFLNYFPSMKKLKPVIWEDDLGIMVPPETSHSLTINYQYADGTKAADSSTATLDAGAAYSVESPAITGYIPDIPTVSGAMPSEDLTVTVTYAPISYTLTVNYQYTGGGKASDSVIQPVAYKAAYNVQSPVIEGYSPDRVSVAGTMPNEDVTTTVIYTQDVVYPVLTVNYQYEDGTQAADSVAGTYVYNSPYYLISPEIGGYTPDKATVTGRMPPTDLTLTVTYKKTPDSGGGDDGGGTGGGSIYDPFKKPDFSTWDGYDPFKKPSGGDYDGYDPFKKPSAESYEGYDPFKRRPAEEYNGYDPFALYGRSH